MRVSSAIGQVTPFSPGAELRLKLCMLMPDPALAGGVGEFVRTQLSHLSDQVDVTTMVVGRRSHQQNRFRATWRVIVDVLRFAMIRWRGRCDVLCANPSLARKSLIRDGTYVALARVMRVNGVVVFFHGWDQELAARINASWWARGLFRRVFGAADHVYVLSTQFKETLVSIGLPASMIEVTTTMFEGAALKEIEHPQGASSASDVIRLIFMGRVVVDKGILQLVEAVRILRDEGVPIELIVAGDGPARAAVLDLVKAYSLSEIVQCPGFVAGREKAALLGSAHTFVLPTSHPEGCPVSILEAMAVGLPIVSTPVGGIPEIVEDSVNGYLLSEVTPEALAAVIRMLFDDPAAMKEIGLRNKEAAWSRYEGKAVTSMLEQRYWRIGAGALSAPAK